MGKKLLAAVALLGILTAGCELRADLRLELAADESGRLLVTVGLDEEFKALVESGGESVEDAMFGADNPFGEIPGAEVRSFTEDEFTYFEASAPFSDLDELAALTANDEAGNLVDEFAIVFTEDTASVSAAVDLGELTGGDLADDQLAGIGTDALAEFFKFTVQIDMPGEVSRHNADRVLDDGSLVWDIPLDAATQTLSVQAESSLTEGGGFPGWLIALIVVVLVAVVLFLVVRSRGGSAPTPATEGDAPAAPEPVVTELSEPDPPTPPSGS